MFSRLDPLFKVNLRHTESTDTRQGIRRDEEKNDQPGSREKKSEAESETVWEDRTEVSVQALIAFLESLMRETTGTASAPAAESTIVQTPAKARSDAAKAAGAYQSTAQRQPGPGPAAAPPETSAPSIALTTDEQRAIHQLLSDLRVLQEKQVTALTILRSDSFLQSLKNAVLLARQ